MDWTKVIKKCLTDKWGEKISLKIPNQTLDN